MAVIDLPPLLTTEETAQLINVKKSTLDTWRCLGRYSLPFVRIGRLVRYRREDVLKWLDRNTEGREQLDD